MESNQLRWANEQGSFKIGVRRLSNIVPKPCQKWGDDANRPVIISNMRQVKAACQLQQQRHFQLGLLELRLRKNLARKKSYRTHQGGDFTRKYQTRKYSKYFTSPSTHSKILGKNYMKLDSYSKVEFRVVTSIPEYTPSILG